MLEFGDGHADIDEHAGAERVAGVGHDGPDADVAGVPVFTTASTPATSMRCGPSPSIMEVAVTRSPAFTQQGVFLGDGEVEEDAIGDALHADDLGAEREGTDRGARSGSDTVVPPKGTVVFLALGRHC